MSYAKPSNDCFNPRMTPPDLKVWFSDAHVLVLEKPAGLLSVPGRGEDKQDCLSTRAQTLFPDACIVHRLDMATSGLMVMARGALVQRRLNDAFANRLVNKRYQAVVDGLMPPAVSAWGEIDLPIAVDWPNRPRRIIQADTGKPSLTRWRLLEANPERHITRIELEPVTGRSHQLRVHMLAIGHAILGDALYACPRVQALSPRLLLHACSITFKHPVSGEPLHFVSPPGF